MYQADSLPKALAAWPEAWFAQLVREAKRHNLSGVRAASQELERLGFRVSLVGVDHEANPAPDRQ
jgi:hypothetical protein